jgi:2-phospho-L-lactate/phosphoenolpyruvate guanylyltransferase
MRTAAILPVKRFAHAKQRLGSSVAGPLRRRLAIAMVGDVLGALARTASIEWTILVTGERSLADAARERGVLVVEDSRDDGQSAAVTLGVRRALAEGIERVLCIPGDCPALDPAELERLLSAGPAPGGPPPRPEVVIVPDRHGTGTNGLLLAPPDAIAPSFGPGSCERHLALARAGGVACRIQRPASLTLDVDTGEDLAALRERLARAGAYAARTSALLGRDERGAAVAVGEGA